MTEILQHPHPMLASVAAEVKDFDAPKLMSIVTEMIRTMHAGSDHAVGLAAPQIGVLQRIIVLDCSQLTLVAVNPQIEFLSREEVIGEESCLSLRDCKPVNVYRCPEISMQWQDVTGVKFSKVFRGFQARLIQHEVDHLDGITLVERIR